MRLNPKRLPDYIKTHLKNTNTVVDIGCGKDSPLRDVEELVHTVGIDAYKPALEISRSKNIHNEYIHGKVPSALSKIESNTFDAAVAIDVLEHLTKKEGDKMLKEMLRIAQKKVIVFTPNGFIPQNPYDNNPYQIHNSGWRHEEFEEKGFNVIGVNGLKYLRGKRASLIRPKSLTRYISRISQHFVKYFPKYAFALFAYKSLNSD